MCSHGLEILQVFRYQILRNHPADLNFYYYNLKTPNNYQQWLNLNHVMNSMYEVKG